MTDLIKDTQFSTTVLYALSGFQKALAKRWNERVAKDIHQGKYNFPQRFRAEGKDLKGVWDYTDEVNRFHIVHGDCKFIAWANSGQTSDLRSVICPGLTNAALYGGLNVPPRIACGIGNVLAEIENRAWLEAHEVFLALPKFDAHDLDKLEHAHKSLLGIGGRLGLKADAGSGLEIPALSGGNGDLPQLAQKITGSGSTSPGWWEGWTGLSANSLRDGFAASVGPSITHQGEIAGAAAILVAARMSVINKARHSILELINNATKALGDKIEATVSFETQYKIVKTAADCLGFAGIFSGPFDVIGKTLTMGASLGELLYPNAKHLVYAHQFEPMMEQLWVYVADIWKDLADREDEYDRGVHTLRDKVYAVHSFNLEMYDLTENHATGSGHHDGYTADVSTVLSVAATCFDCAQVYEESIIPALGEAESAESHLAGEDGAPTGADTNLIELIAELRGYLTTACGRLYTAGEEVKAAAEAYSNTDDHAKSAFTDTMRHWHEGPAPAHAKEWAQDTDRSTYEEAKPLQPGHADPGKANYETELSGR